MSQPGVRWSRAVSKNTRRTLLQRAYLGSVQTGGPGASLRSSEAIGAHQSSTTWGASLALQVKGERLFKDGNEEMTRRVIYSELEGQQLVLSYELTLFYLYILVDFLCMNELVELAEFVVQIG